MPISDNRVKICVRIYPNADRNEVAGFVNGMLHIRISAPPVKGKANIELIGFLSRFLGISKDNIIIIKGHTKRNKLVIINGLSKDSLSMLINLKGA